MYYPATSIRIDDVRGFYRFLMAFWSKSRVSDLFHAKYVVRCLPVGINKLCAK